MRVCKVDPKHKNFQVCAWEHHDWVVDENGNYIETRGCYESGLHEGSSWSCAECGADTKIVKTVAELSEQETKYKLIQLQMLCHDLAKAHENYNHLVVNDLLKKIRLEIAEFEGD
jgi:hypothetical protein